MELLEEKENWRMLTSVKNTAEILSLMEIATEAGPRKCNFKRENDALQKHNQNGIKPLKSLALESLPQFKQQHSQRVKTLEQKIYQLSLNSNSICTNMNEKNLKLQELHDRLSHEMHLRLQCSSENSLLKDELALKKLELSETVKKLTMTMELSSPKQSSRRKKINNRALEQQIDQLKNVVVKLQAENAKLRVSKPASTASSSELNTVGSVEEESKPKFLKSSFSSLMRRKSTGDFKYQFQFSKKAQIKV
jgi:hypothetical protein